MVKSIIGYTVVIRIIMAFSVIAKSTSTTISEEKYSIFSMRRGTKNSYSRKAKKK